MNKLLCVLFLPALALAGCRAEKTQPPPVPMQQVQTIMAVTATSAVPVEAIATLRRKVEPVLSFKVGGPVATVLVREGDAVKRGQPLATLRTDEIDSEVSRAQSKLEQERRDLARAERLYAEQAAPLEEVQNARSSVEQAAAAERAAKFNRELCVITAPADGRILHRHAEPGELLAPGRPVVTFASEEEGWIAVAAVSARDIGTISVGNAAVIPSTAGVPELRGTVAHVAEAADPATRTYDVEIRIDRVPAGLRSGAIATARIQPSTATAETELPLGALIAGEGETAIVCTVADNGVVSRIPVRIRHIAGDRVRLATPLPAGTRVIAVGAEFLREGQTVQVERVEATATAVR